MNDASTTASLASRIQLVRSKSGIEAWLIEDYTVPLIAMEMAMLGGSSQTLPQSPAQQPSSQACLMKALVLMIQQPFMIGWMTTRLSSVFPPRAIKSRASSAPSHDIVRKPSICSAWR